ncbi:RNA polymerase sigma factor [Longimycelium tulufanense]|uniref:RNA polymerase sigma factor n=1 Tax=Longimycelium tulufanense TaxID=907463 RepID=A0A8J3FXM1_9PSEU|nr:RNA polymerase sigma factor [Longimycelium tulufanense]
MAAAVADEPGAWRCLVLRFTDLVWTVARGHCADPADADDVCQVVWLKLAQHLPSLRDPARLPAWLVTVTRREARRAAALRRREQPWDFGDAVGAEPGPEERVLRDEREIALWRVFQRLPERCQQLLRLLAVTPTVSYADLANAVDRPVGSVGPTRTRCLRVLADLLAEAGLLDTATSVGRAEVVR